MAKTGDGVLMGKSTICQQSNGEGFKHKTHVFYDKDEQEIKLETLTSEYMSDNKNNETNRLTGIN